jgi:hypothetical protein
MQIPLVNNRGVALIDDQDSHWASYRWHRHSGGYAAASMEGCYVLLHRAILGLTDPSIQIDHRNRNRLDCRRPNLRIVAAAQNSQNHSGFPQATSIYRGVSWDRVNRRWRAHVMLNRRAYSLGRFFGEVDAARTAEAFRREHLPYAEHDMRLDPVPPCRCRLCRTVAHGLA